MDGQTDRWMDEQTGRWTDGQICGQKDGPTDNELDTYFESLCILYTCRIPLRPAVNVLSLTLCTH